MDEKFLTDEYFADPYSVYAELRRRAPVYWSDRFEAWILTRHSDVAAVIKDTDKFSNAERIPTLLRQLPPDTHANLADLSNHFSVGLVHSDPPDHTRLRALVSKAFTPRSVESMRPRIESLVNELLEEANDEFDIVEQFAYPLPMIIISDMVGIPSSDREQFKAWSSQIFGFIGSGKPDAATAVRSQEALRELVAYFKQLFAHRRRHPGPDLLSQLVLVEEAGDRLSEDELLSLCSTFVSAGHETTTSLIASGALTLLRHPHVASDVNNDANLVAALIEEVLRHESPLQRDLKVAAVDVEISGVEIRSGDLVYAMLGAANRDPAQFDDPDEFQLRRPRNRHLSFGFGAHFCLGAPLARLEAQIALAAVANRACNMKLASDTFSWRHDIALRSLTRLDVEPLNRAPRTMFGDPGERDE